MRTLLKRILPILGATALILLLVLDGRRQHPALQFYHDEASLMGTVVSISVYAVSAEQADTAFRAAFRRIEGIEQIASSHAPDSELSKLNAEGGTTRASAELLEILQESIQIAELSSGGFDATVEPLLALWRFDANQETQFWDLDPDAQQIAIQERIALVGASRITLGTESPTWIELQDGTKLNLGGIAKGYAVDQAIEALVASGIEHALVDAGGDICVVGGKPDGSVWEIALRDPDDEARVVASFALADGAIATSGNYLRFFDPEAQVGHILDPRTGYAAERASSATVIASNCMRADALATAAFVLGPVEGITMVEGIPGIEAMILPLEEPTSIARSSGLSTFERAVGDLR